MGNFAMTIWNSTCNPCFSTFDQFFFVFHELKTGFFCYSLKLNFICYPNKFFTYDYSLWDGGDISFCGQKQTNFMCAYPWVSWFWKKLRSPIGPKFLIVLPGFQWGLCLWLYCSQDFIAFNFLKRFFTNFQIFRRWTIFDTRQNRTEHNFYWCEIHIQRIVTKTTY